MKLTPTLLLALCMLMMACNRHTTHPEKPNILFLFADDLTFQAVHALGNPLIHTPNLDKLVKNGTSFSHAYNMGGWHGAICAASRTMLMSGKKLWPAWDWHQAWKNRDTSAMDQSLGRLMAAQGYDTYMSGKWHVSAPADYVFDHARHIRPGMPGDRWPAFWQYYRDLLTGKQPGMEDVTLDEINWKDILPAGYHRPNSPDDTTWSPTDSSFGGFWEGGQHWSEVLRDDALDYLGMATQSEKPFFMYIAFNAPHDPRQAPQEYLDLYPLDKIPLPDNFLAEYPYKDSIGNSITLRDEALAPMPRTEFAVKTHIREYYGIISHMDAQIGKILDALEASGKMDETIIFFSADHGLSVGQHGLIGKQNMFDHSMRVPLILSGPGIPKGNIIDADIYLQDLMPTALELAGYAARANLDFHSLMPFVRDGKTDSHYAGIYGAYIDLQRMIRKDGFKLISYPKVKKHLLFDLKTDPWEMNDLAEQPEYAEKLSSLKQDLKVLQGQMEDELQINW